MIEDTVSLFTLGAFSTFPRKPNYPGLLTWGAFSDEPLLPAVAGPAISALPRLAAPLPPSGATEPAREKATDGTGARVVD